MALRRYPVWDDPEIDDWRDDYFGDPERCFPLGAIVGIGAIGLLAFCRPRRSCRPRFGFFAGSCYPFLSCTPTYICAPRSCFPAPLF